VLRSFLGSNGQIHPYAQIRVNFGTILEAFPKLAAQYPSTDFSAYYFRVFLVAYE
jgi:hypothetical protein